MRDEIDSPRRDLLPIRKRQMGVRPDLELLFVGLARDDLDLLRREIVVELDARRPTFLGLADDRRDVRLFVNAACPGRFA